MYSKTIHYYGGKINSITILKNIRNLVVPKWRNSNPSKRVLALFEISKEKLSLAAKYEPEDSIREKALHNLAYGRFDLDMETIEIIAAEKNPDIKLEIFTGAITFTNNIDYIVNILRRNISEKLNNQCYLRLQRLTCCYNGEIEEPYQETEIVDYEEIIDYAPAGPDTYPLKEVSSYIPIKKEVTKYRKVPVLDPQATLEKRTATEKQYGLEPGCLSKDYK